MSVSSPETHTALDSPRRREASATAWFYAVYSHLGLLVPISLLALAGGALLQHSYTELPSIYTWLQPFRTLRGVAHLPGLFSAAGAAYALGALARKDRRSLRELWLARGEPLAALRDPARRLPLLIRCLAGVAVVALDFLFLPQHTLLDALALGGFGFVLARPYSRPELRRALVHGACTVLVFTAVCYWFTVVKALTFIGSFTQRDRTIVAFEHALTGVHPYRLLAAWSSHHPGWVAWFDWAYTRLFHHMALASAFLFGLRDARQRTEYLSALAICYFVGGPLYWLMPAAGPAYFSPSTYAFLRSYPSLQVNWMQAVLYQNTAEVDHGQADALITWSYIACMPSLHLAHESVMLFYARASRLFFVLSLAFTLLTAVGVVALGWHYPTDILAGIALAVFSILLCRWQSDRLLPLAATR
jgi:membrane-associated phospholipid phosphatase